MIVQLGAGGMVDLFNAAGNLDLIADVGTTTTGGTFVGLPPNRIVDTRDGTGGIGSSLWPAEPVAAEVLKVTATGSTAASYLTIWPDAAARPLASDLNWVSGQTIPNTVVVQLGSDGKIGLFSPAGYTDVLIDVVGYYS